jgi:hypothetical protein
MKKDLEAYYQIRPAIIGADDDECGTAGLIEWSTDGILGPAIQGITGQDVNHTSMIIVMRLVGDVKRRVFILEEDEHGLHPAYLSSRIEEFKGHANFVPLRRKYSPIKNVIANHMLDLNGTPYDYKALFTNAWRRAELNPDKLYCSESVHWAIKQSVGDDEFRDHMREAGLYRRVDGRDVYYGARPGEFTLLGFHGESEKIF